MLKRVCFMPAGAAVAVFLLCYAWPAALLSKPAVSMPWLDKPLKDNMPLAEQEEQQQQQLQQLQQQPPASLLHSLQQTHAPLTSVPASLQLPLVPRPAWLSQCCLSKKLRELYLPGSHDSGTGHPWTVPHHLPFVFDEVAAVLFNIVGDLSRTQHHNVYEQLQAGVRVLDLRLALNPWIALQHRATKGSSHLSAGDSSSKVPGRAQKQPQQPQRPQQQQLMHMTQDSSPASFFHLSPDTLQGSIDYHSVGGELTAAELAGAVVISHSLPGVRLTELLADVRRFVAEQPTEVLMILVKGDTVDVNIAATQRMSPQAWSAAVDIFRQELPGVQFLTQEQVEQQTLAELVAAGPWGSVLVYSNELQQAGLAALSSKQLEILESWGNGTDTEDVPTLKDKIISWMQFWHDAGWRQNVRPYMLLASAEVTLGVKTILQLLKNRMWLVQEQQQLRQEHLSHDALDEIPMASMAKSNSQPLMQQLPAKPVNSQQFSHITGWRQRLCQWWQQQQQQQQQQQRQQQEQQQLASLGLLRYMCPEEVAPGLRVMRTLYDMGLAANEQLLQDVLLNEQVLKAFNIWSLDALSSDVVDYVIQLNTAPTSS